MTRPRARIVLVFCGLAASAQTFALTRLSFPPAAGEVLRAGEVATLRFALENEHVDEMEVLLSLDGGATFPLRVTRQRTAGTYALPWRVPNLPTTRARLALRVGDEEKGEVIRDVSEEFTILLAAAEPLERVRPFRGEWRTGEALEEIASGAIDAPLDAPRLDETPDSFRSLPSDVPVGRTSDAPSATAPAEVDRETVEPAPPISIRPPASPRLALDLPRRE